MSVQLAWVNELRVIKTAISPTRGRMLGIWFILFVSDDQKKGFCLSEKCKAIVCLIFCDENLKKFNMGAGVDCL